MTEGMQKELERRGRAQADEDMRMLRGPDAAVEARTKAVVTSSSAERIAFLLDSARLLREFLVEAEWRAPALCAISDLALLPDEEDADEIACTVNALWSVFHSFRDYVLFGNGQHSGSWEPRTDFFGLSDAAPELERRIALNGREADRKARVERLVCLGAELEAEDPRLLDVLLGYGRTLVRERGAIADRDPIAVAIELEQRAASAEGPAR